MEFTDYFDVITLWAVFEHVTNPAEYLKKLYGMLKKNGYLVIQVQNIDSWQASLNLVDWFHFDTPRHVYNYTPYNLSVFLKKNGFSIREIKHFSTEHGIFGWFQTIFNYLGFEFNVFYKFIKHGIINKNPFQLAMNILISPVICVVSIMLHIIESICSKSGIITVVAEKNN